MKRDKLMPYVGKIVRVELSNWTAEGVLERYSDGKTFEVDEVLFSARMVRSVTPLKQTTY